MGIKVVLLCLAVICSGISIEGKGLPFRVNNGDASTPQRVMARERFHHGKNRSPTNQLSPLPGDGPGDDSGDSPVDTIDIDFEMGNKKVDLHLSRSNNANLNAPVTFASGKVVETPKIEGVELYQDVQHGAVMTVKKNKGKRGKDCSMIGSFVLDDERYAFECDDEEDENESNQLQDDEERTPHKVYKLDDKKGKIAARPIDSNRFEGDKPPGKPRQDYFEISETPKQAPGDAQDEDDSSSSSSSEDEDNDENARSKRQAPNIFYEYDVEVLFVICHTIWDKFMEDNNNNELEALTELKIYFSNQMNGIDLAYRNIDDSGYRIRPFLSGYYIAETRAESTWTVQSLYSGQSGITDPTQVRMDGNKALNALGSWTNSGSRSWDDYDHAMLWTLYQIFGDGTIGYAPLGGVCIAELATSLVQFRDFHDWLTAAHELGHGLGADHDGTNGQCASSVDRYIMYPSAGGTDRDNIRDNYFFSECSKDQFRRTLRGEVDGYQRVCLLNRVCDHEQPYSDTTQLAGEIYHLHEQCQYEFGPSSYFCGDIEDEDVCFNRRCYVNGRCTGNADIYRDERVAEGTPCGRDGTKWCREGSCQSKTDSPPLSDGIRYGCTETVLSTTVPSGCSGDVSGWGAIIYGQDAVCADVPRKYPDLCFTWSWSAEGCCESCARAGLKWQDQETLATVAPPSGDTTTTTTTTKSATTTTTTRRPSTTTTTTTTNTPSSTDSSSTTYSTTMSTTTEYVICPPGEYEDFGFCFECPAGTYRSREGGYGLESCWVCPAGTYSKDGATSCTSCPAGRYSSSSASLSCSRCPQGTYSSTTGSKSCTKCAIGYYESSTGSTGCDKCPAGETTTSTGSTSSGDCKAITECVDTHRRCKKFYNNNKCNSQGMKGRTGLTWKEWMTKKCPKICGFC